MIFKAICDQGNTLLYFYCIIWKGCLYQWYVFLLPASVRLIILLWNCWENRSRGFVLVQASTDVLAPTVTSLRPQKLLQKPQRRERLHRRDEDLQPCGLLAFSSAAQTLAPQRASGVRSWPANSFRLQISSEIRALVSLEGIGAGLSRANKTLTLLCSWVSSKECERVFKLELVV